MKLAISNIAWDRREDQAVAAVLEQHNIIGLDVAPGKLSDNPTHLTQQDIQPYIDFWADHGIQIVGMQSMLYGHPELTIFDDEATRHQTLDYLKAIIDLAAMLGVGPMVFGSPKNRRIGDLPIEQAHEIAVEFFTALAHHAHTRHTILCLEPNPAQYGADYVLNTNEALELVHMVDHPGFRLHLDAAIMTLNEEDIPTSLQNGMDQLAHFHISEPQLGIVQAGGAVDHALISQTLRQVGYEGWGSIEMRGGWTETDAESIQTATAFVSKVYGQNAD